MKEADGLVERMSRAIEKHVRDEQTLQIAKLPDYTSLQKKKVFFFSSALLIMTVGFLLGLRRLSSPEDRRPPERFVEGRR